MKPKTHRRAGPVGCFVVLAAFGAASAARGAESAARGAAAATVQGSSTTGTRITIKDFMFAPTALTIKAGSTVTWINNDDEPHTVVSATGLFRSSAFDTGGTFAHTFDKPGIYKIICSLHPRMMGTIVVE